MGIRVGIDTGGTFTDLVAIDESGSMKLSKVSSTPDDSSAGIMDAIGKAGVQLRDVTFFAAGQYAAALSCEVGNGCLLWHLTLRKKDRMKKYRRQKKC